MSRLIITNGDMAAEKMREARINGEILCWRDVLHEGPVPETATLEELSVIRADHLAFRGWGSVGSVRESFARRDAVMRALDRFSEVTLWFEHDLYDQLQLLQIVDFLAPDKSLLGRCFLIQAGNFIGTEKAARLRTHLKLKQPLGRDQAALAQAAWSAFRAPSPEKWAALLRYDISALPFLRPAIMRHLEEFPNPVTGLNRTESFVLSSIQGGICTPAALFAEFQDSEEAAFMGDASFFALLDLLASGAAPFITGLQSGPFSPSLTDEDREAYLSSPLRLTGLGVTTIDRKKDAINFRRLDRWMGGVHLRNENCWRWDATSLRLLAPRVRH